MNERDRKKNLKEYILDSSTRPKANMEPKG